MHLAHETEYVQCSSLTCLIKLQKIKYLADVLQFIFLLDWKVSRVVKAESQSMCVCLSNPPLSCTQGRCCSAEASAEDRYGGNYVCRAESSVLRPPRNHPGKWHIWSVCP